MIAGARVSGISRDGNGARPVLLFVHGVGSTAAIWDYQLDVFGADHLCGGVELRGNGARKPDPEPSSITRAGYADDVLAVADALGAQRFTIVGCSLGGVVAFELWQRAPHRIAAMLILGSFVRYPNGEQVAQSIRAQVREAGDMRTFGERRATQLGLPAARLRETVEQFACKSIECFIAATQATWTGDYSAVLPGINVPVLVAYGEHDAVAPLARAKEIASLVPGAALKSIPGAGHVANADNPEAFNTLLRSFVKRN